MRVSPELRKGFIEQVFEHVKATGRAPNDWRTHLDLLLERGDYSTAKAHFARCHRGNEVVRQRLAGELILNLCLGAPAPFETFKEIGAWGEQHQNWGRVLADLWNFSDEVRARPTADEVHSQMRLLRMDLQLLSAKLDVGAFFSAPFRALGRLLISRDPQTRTASVDVSVRREPAEIP